MSAPTILIDQHRLSQLVQVGPAVQRICSDCPAEALTQSSLIGRLIGPPDVPELGFDLGERCSVLLGCPRPRGRFARAARRLLWPTQADTQGKLAPLLGVVGSGHRVVGL
jgi:hypothetical protein